VDYRLRCRCRAQLASVEVQWSPTRSALAEPTAQRYLAQLVQDGVLELHLRYGSTDRPEHRYRVTHLAAAR
jgi:response regulator of citrate/malate metabolism